MEYFKRNNQWYYTDKSGRQRKVTSAKKLDELNNSIDLTNVESKKTIDGRSLVSIWFCLELIQTSGGGIV